jgi:hypothetical protein
MGSLIKKTLDKIVVENIFLCICKIVPMNDKVALFLSLHLCNKASQIVVDKNEDWGIWCVHVAEFYLDKLNLEKHQKEEWENRGPESYTSKN